MSQDDLTELTCLMSTLPTDLVNHIIPYTYRLQSYELLADIRNYVALRHIATFNLLENYIAYTRSFNTGPFALPYNYSTHYHNNYAYLSLFLRLFNIKTYIEISHYSDIFQYKPTHIKHNILWGLLTIRERYEFIALLSTRRF